jgi:N-acetylmuramate 1-kinase
MHDRENVLKQWLAQTINQEEFTLTTLAGDASFRKYFRLHFNGQTRVIMDAPPSKEDLEPFIHVAHCLKNQGVLTPEILAVNKEHGFLLMSDLGDTLLLGELTANSVDNYYKQAIHTLFNIQRCSIDDPKIPYFDKAFMLQEMSLCIDWFLNKYLSIQLTSKEELLLRETMTLIAEEVSQQPLVFIHRDYHSRNLMIVGDELGVIDFQDAMRGPITYDLVSLLKDCYVAWPREQLLSWVEFYHQLCPQTTHYSAPEFIRAFDLCGLQRHLKVLGVFSRLHLRDNKPGYLKDLPLTLSYVLQCTETYEELRPLYHFLQNKVRLP